MRILIVEDEIRLAQSLQRGLETEQFAIVHAATGDDGFLLATTEVFDLLVLDLMLPGRDGLEILRSLRQRGITTPVLILSARDTVQDRVQGLNLGADDYLVKPFAYAELLARVRALARRGQAPEPLQLAVSDLELNRMTRRVCLAGEPIALTVREYELLEYLLQQRGNIVSRDMLARNVWREVRRATPLDNVIDVHIARLRKKIDQGRSTPLIHTVRGLGFLLDDAKS